MDLADYDAFQSEPSAGVIECLSKVGGTLLVLGTGGKMEEKFGHGTQKPLECMLRPILNNSAKGQAVYDPFCGSGTTLLACEKSDRVCYAMELSPAYVDMIVARWEKETGKQAILDETTLHNKGI